jgi:hypothetical protein
MPILPGKRAVRDPRSLACGLVLVALAAVALWGTRTLHQGTLMQMGPAMFPRYIAAIIGLAGIGLTVRAFLRDGPAIEPIPLRGPVLVTLSVVLFGLTVRRLGLAVAGPLSLVLASLATPEATPRSTFWLVVLVTGFCVLLFRVFLDLALPILVIPGTGVAF